MKAEEIKIGQLVRLPNELTGVVAKTSEFTSPVTGITIVGNVTVKTTDLNGAPAEFNCPASMLRPAEGPEAAPKFVEELV